MSENDSTAIEYMKLQWADLHHSRLQDWSFLGVIAGVLYAIVNVQNPELSIGLSLLGLLISILGASMAWQHYQIVLDKLIVIEKMEHRLGIQYPSRTTLLPVQILIFLLFAGIASGFVSMTLYFWSEISHYDYLQRYSFFVGVGFFLAIFACVIVLRIKYLNRAPFRYNTAYFAELDKLEQCIEQLGDRPLKLIADERWAQLTFREIPWDNSEWDFFTDNNLIIKPILLNRRDSFQFSIANASSKQDWHYHKFVFEIYVSNNPISLEYRAITPDKKQQVLKVSKGVIIVPPGLPHKITLSGTTFVFQATLADKNLSKDKIITENG
jgi:hypothetical protein